MLEEKFAKKIIKNIQEAYKLGCYPRKFLSILNNHSAVEAVKRWIHSSNVCCCIEFLKECGRLDLSVEAEVLNWPRLFNEDDIKRAKQRLLALDFEYFKKNSLKY